MAKDLVTKYCFACVRNEIGGLKGITFRKAFPDIFQSVDMLDEIEDTDIQVFENDTEKDKENARNAEDSSNEGTQSQT
jgi:hypothetical protein